MRPLHIVCLLLLFSSVVIAQPRTLPLVVSTSWVAEHLSDPDLVLLHVTFSRPEYKAGHIPGAQFLWYNGLSVSTPDASAEMPSVQQADTLLESFGITSRSKIVVIFGRSSVPTTTRMFLALTYFGFGNQVGFLDGGFEQWKSEKRPVSKETPMTKRSSLVITTHPEVLATAEMIRDNLSSPAVTIVDARDKSFYDGEGGGISRQGHIRGAKSVPFSTVLDSLSRLKDHAALQKLFEDAGIKKGTKIISYCHVGQQATVIYLVARLLGYDAAVYDGSFEDWNVRPEEEYPVDKTVKPKS